MFTMALNKKTDSYVVIRSHKIILCIQTYLLYLEIQQTGVSTTLEAPLTGLVAQDIVSFYKYESRYFLPITFRVEMTYDCTSYAFIDAARVIIVIYAINY